MFFKKDSKPKKISVKTSKELAEAIKRKEQKIEVTGELGKKLLWMAKISPKKISVIMGILAASAITVPLTAGCSAPLLTALSAEVGADFALLIMTSAVSISMLIALFKGYNVTINVDGDSVCFEKK